MRIVRNFLLAAALGAELCGFAAAEGTRSISSITNRPAGACDTSIGVGASAEALDFDDVGDSNGWHDKTFAQALTVRNRGTVDIMVQTIPWDGSHSSGGSVSAAQLTTPTEDGSETIVRVIPAGTTFAWSDLQIIGLRWQGVTSAGNACADWTY